MNIVLFLKRYIVFISFSQSDVFSATVAVARATVPTSPVCVLIEFAPDTVGVTWTHEQPASSGSTLSKKIVVGASQLVLQ